MGVDAKNAVAPPVSVLLPVRNGTGTLLPALVSLQRQTFDAFELLVIDDRSSDATADLVRGFGDPRVRLLDGGPTPGLAARLNEGIDAARGDFIARMDADDLSFPERLTRQVNFMTRNPGVDLIGTQALVHNGAGSVIGLFPYAESHAEICRAPWRGFHLCHPTWLGRAEWFRRWRYREAGTPRCEDQELLLRSHRESRFACLPDILLAYRWERFRLSKALPARLAMLRWQCVDFAAHHQWHWVAAAVAMAGSKLLTDVLATVDGRRFFDWRFGAQPDEALRRRWVDLLEAVDPIAASIVDGRTK